MVSSTGWWHQPGLEVLEGRHHHGFNAGIEIAQALECLDAGFYAEDAMPTPLAGGDGWMELAFAAIRVSALLPKRR